MSTVQRTAGIAGFFTYTLNQVPASAPVMTIYSDALRTTVAVPAATLAATANPSVFTASYPATLAAGTYYLSFATVFTAGQPAHVDNDDELALSSPSGSVLASYATIADARAFGLTEPSDTALSEYLEIGSRMVDNYTGKSFEGSTTKTVTINQVYNGVVPLPVPFSNVTAVTVNNGAPITNYTVEPWGIRLDFPGWKDADGFPTYWNKSYRGPAKVSVTATFGHSSVPSVVKRATLILARDVFQGSGATPSFDPRVSSLSVEGYSITYRTDDEDDQAAGLTTGNADVDRLLMPYRKVAA